MKTNNTEFDVVVVGAGPAGSVVAEALALASLRVALLEEHPCVGLPNHCSGLVSPRTLQLAGVAEEMVEGVRFSGARVWGPGDKTLWLQSDSVRAVAVDRPKFDQILAERAVSAGATLMLRTRAYRFERLKRGVQVDAQTGADKLHLRAPLLIGADGARSQVARWMGRRVGIEQKRGYEIIPVVKADIAFRSCGTDSIEIFVGNSVAPGWFGWIIPVRDGIARIGIGIARTEARTTTGSLRYCFEAFLDLIRHKFGDFAAQEVGGSVLPLGPARDFAADRVMLVGAAARQTKPTTGGGIYFGMRAAHLAAATAVRAVERGDCSHQVLAEYERAWHRLEGRELLYGHWLRRGFRHLSDSDLNLMIELLNKSRVQGLISRLGDIDFPSRLFMPLVTALWKQAPPRALEMGVEMEARHLAGIGGMRGMRA